MLARSKVVKLLNWFFSNDKDFAEINLRFIRENLQRLGNRYMDGTSESSDFQEWEQSLDILYKYIDLNINDTSAEAFGYGITQVFTKYLLKHHPNDDRLIMSYSDPRGISEARGSLYREMLIRLLGETLWITHVWEYSNKEKYKEFISSINEYVNLHNGKEILGETLKCMDTSEQLLTEKLYEVKKNILYYTKEQKEWHKKVERLCSFKF